MKAKNWTTLIVIAMILSASGLVITEFNHPGTCPPYFNTGFPACLVMGIYFIIMLITHFSKGRMPLMLYYIIGIVAILSATYYSVNEIMGTLSCPRAFNIPIPLCFAAWVMILIALILKLSIPKKVL